MANEEKKKKPPELKLSEDMQVLFANLVRVSHTPAEIVLDFAQMLPAQEHIDVLSRIIMTPMGTKLFFTALRDNLARYEAAFGEIKMPRNNSLANDLFKSVQPPKNPESSDDES
ncbi:MAG: DUF3467 domain-containing protein [Anaerolineaceae bacterium]|nr:DUF3467 domain-containing protein [Anaerolineaceae bacterium]